MSLMLCCVVGLATLAANAPEESVVDKVWAGHVVGFSLLTHPPCQFAAYYDAERHMTVARRTLGEAQWQHVHLPEQLQWDSHNSVTLAVDNGGYLHVSGNMHVKPLVYFRSQKPLDIESLSRAAMVGQREERCTYPQFLKGPNGQLVFTYRDGKSGDGDQIYNTYDEASQTWRRLLDRPLTDGQGKMNAYCNGPLLGPDGRYHLAWVWRDTPGCETNHDLCYARSIDMVHWETSAGKPLELPITLSTAEIVDPVPVKTGMINSNVKLGFDSSKRPVITYHKFDEAGNTQVFNARYEDGAWKTRQASNWDYRWDFSGGGTIRSDISVSAVSLAKPGQLRQTYSHVKEGKDGWFLDEATLQPLESAKPPKGASGLTPTAQETQKAKASSGVKSTFPGMQLRTAADLGNSGEPGVHYVMQWETLGPNRDQPLEGPLPEPSVLRVLKVE